MPDQPRSIEELVRSATQLRRKVQHTMGFDAYYCKPDDIQALYQAGAAVITANQPRGSSYESRVIYEGVTFKTSSRERLDLPAPRTSAIEPGNPRQDS